MLLSFLNLSSYFELLFYIFLTFFLMFSLYIIAENFLIPNLENISKFYNLKSLEGILLGIGGSIPELTTNLIATLKGKIEIGIGAISGSGAMVLIFCFGLAGIVCKKNSKLNFFAYFRDILMYLISIFLLVFFLKDKKIFFSQVCVMIVLFPIYVFIVNFCSICQNKNNEKNEENENENEKNLIEMEDIENNNKNNENNNKKNNNKNIFLKTYNFTLKFYSYFLPKNEQYPTLSFIINLIFILIHSNILIILIQIISNLLKIKQNFLGMTLISWGDNIGDILNTFILARKNNLETLSNSLISSQIFNILICLNFPWLILLIKNKFFYSNDFNNDFNNYIEIKFNNFYSLFIAILSSIIIIVLFCMKLNKINGIILIIIYFYYLYYEFNLSNKN